jgi:hypothetical protein
MPPVVPHVPWGMPYAFGTGDTDYLQILGTAAIPRWFRYSHISYTQVTSGHLSLMLSREKKNSGVKVGIGTNRLSDYPQDPGRERTAAIARWLSYSHIYRSIGPSLAEAHKARGKEKVTSEHVW